MKGLVPLDDPAETRSDNLQEVQGYGSLADDGVGAVVLRQEAYAGVAIDYPSDQENVYREIPIPRHSAARALDKPERSLYEQVGKPPIFGRPHYRRAFTLNSKTLSIDAWPAESGRVDKFIRDNTIAIARGLQMALADNANIEVPTSVPLGSLRQVEGFSPVALTDLYQR